MDFPPDDPHGYVRLARSLDFVANELRHAGFDEGFVAIDRARAFRSGSPTEYLGEAALALDWVLRHSTKLSPSLVAFMSALAAELRAGLQG